MTTITVNKNIVTFPLCLLDLNVPTPVPRVQTRSQTFPQRRKVFSKHIHSLLAEVWKTPIITEKVVIITKIFDYIRSHKNIFNLKEWGNFRIMVWDRLTEFETDSNFPAGRALYYKGVLFPNW